MRNLFQKILDETNTITIRDPLSIVWTEFPFNNGFKIHMITSVEIYKPYLISVKYYSTIEYEDIILLINNIEDIFEVLPGTEIRIPDYNELIVWLSERQQTE